MADLTSKIVLITAAAQGIGRASVEAFVAAGAKVIATDINAEKLKELDGMPNVTTRILDVLSADAVKQAVAEIGRIDVLFNCAGVVHGGTVLEMTSEPAASGMAGKVKHKSYPTKVWGSFVWVYMGPQDNVPEFTPPAWAPTADTRVTVAKTLLPCNWAQILEGAIDSAHSSSLHSSDMVPARVAGAEATDSTWLRPSTDKAPRMQVERGGYGFRYAAIRRPISGAAANDYIRSTVFVAPATALIPPNNMYNVANINVPMDDTNTAFYFIAWGHKDQTPDTATWRKFLGQTVGTDLDAQYVPLRNRSNMFWQDRGAMKAGNFTGITGFPNQDIAMWVTMGPIADRTHERLGASDIAVVEFRKQMLEAVQAFQGGATAIGTGEARIPKSVVAFQAIVPKTTDWRAYQAHYVWTDKEPELEPSYSTNVPQSV